MLLWSAVSSSLVRLLKMASLAMGMFVDLCMRLQSSVSVAVLWVRSVLIVTVLTCTRSRGVLDLLHVLRALLPLLLDGPPGEI